MNKNENSRNDFTERRLRKTKRKFFCQQYLRL